METLNLDKLRHSSPQKILGNGLDQENNSLAEFKKQLLVLLAEGEETLIVTNQGIKKRTVTTYCLWVKKNSLELLERSGSSKVNKFVFDLESETFEKNGEIKGLSFFGLFSQKIHGIGRDLIKKEALAYRKKRL